MLLLSLIFSFLAHEGQSYYAIASFGNDNPNAAAIGNVTVKNGTVSVYLDLANGYADGVFDDACLSGGFTWHAHTEWNNDSATWGTYSACSAAMTAYHYDPLAACGGNTDNALCTQRGGCIAAGLGSGTYQCTGEYYEMNPLYCEVGDWSGKYGRLYSYGDTNTTFMGSWSSFFEVDAKLLANQSVVFHCSGQRAICAGFEVMGADSMEYKPDQEDMKTVMVDFSNAVESIDSSYSSSLSNSIYANGDGSWSVDVSFSLNGASSFYSMYNGYDCFNPTIGMDFYIFSEWNSVEDSLFGDECMYATGGSTWDPTNQCLPMSNSNYCNGTTQCGIANSMVNKDTYSCSSDVDYSCAPGDLSGRWGTLSAFDLQSTPYSISGAGNDDEMPNLANIVGASVGILCSGEFVMCGRIQDISEATATATFSDSMYTNVSGSITVTNQEIMIDIDTSEQDFPAGCATNGLSWHIHDKWTYSDYLSRWTTDCGGSYTGGHYDPYNGCGGATDNQWCYTKLSSGECDSVGDYVDSSTFNPWADNSYTCNATYFEHYPYACEVGDWSGKYGKVMIENDMIRMNYSTQYAEVRATDLIGKSIVFHCSSDSSRVLCAPFTISGTDGNDIAPSASTTSTDYIIAYLEDVTGSGNMYSNYVKIYDDNMVEIIINTTDMTNECLYTDSYRLSLYNTWSGTGQMTQGCSTGNYYDTFYDPGYTCPPQSDNDQCDCINQNYNYTCNYDTEKFSCAAGDLSGKYGMIYPNSTFYYTGYDLTLPPLSFLEGLAVVLECNDDTYTPIGCSGFNHVTTTTTTTTTTEDPTNMTTTNDPENKSNVVHSFVAVVVVSVLFVFVY